MIRQKILLKTPFPTDDETAEKIEEAAYYCFLNRTRYAHQGDALTDWIEAEKGIRAGLDAQGPPHPRPFPSRAPAHWRSHE